MAAASGVEAASSQKPQSAKKQNGEAATEGEFAKAVSDSGSGQKAPEQKVQESQSNAKNQDGEEGGTPAGKKTPTDAKVGDLVEKGASADRKVGDAAKDGKAAGEAGANPRAAAAANTAKGPVTSGAQKPATEAQGKAQGDPASPSKAAKILQASRAAPNGSTANLSSGEKGAQGSDSPTSPRVGESAKPEGNSRKARPESQDVKGEKSAKAADPRVLAKGASDPRERAGDARDGAAKDTTRAAEAKTDAAKDRIGARLGGQATSNAVRDFGGLVHAQNALTGQSRTTDLGGDRSQATSSQAPTSASGAEARAAVGADRASGQARTPPAQQVAVRVAKAASAGQSKLQIDIKPPELGRVEVRIDFQGNSLRVSVGAERQEALDMLQRDARALTKALNDAGFDTKGGLEFNLRSGGGSRHGKGAPAKFMEFYDEADSDREGATGSPAQAAAPVGARLAITV